MKTIISASRRTDIPAFYYKWLQEQLKQGYVDVPNPLYPEKVSRVDLSPENIHSIVLWSKDMKNILNPGLLERYNLYFQYTITGYNKLLEPNAPSYVESMETLERLSHKYNPKQFNIRFDPIIICPDAEENKCRETFKGESRLLAWERLLKDLKTLHFDDCRITVSFLSVYNHVHDNMYKAGLSEDDYWFDNSEEVAFMKMMSDIAKSYNREIYTCANDRFVDAGIDNVKKGHCIDGDILAELFGKCTSSKDKSQRLECGCIKSRDIGLYTQKCGFKCAYCYAQK